MSKQNHSAEPGSEEVKLGIAGNMAKAFINSPLTPMFLAACLLVGFIGIWLTPRQEDPQISVPMFDIFVNYPGASARQVANTAISPLERAVSDIAGVKHVYSVSEKSRGIVTVQFRVGESEEVSRTKLKAKLDSNMGFVPPGVQPPLIQNKGVDSVPVVTLTLWSEKLDDSLLRKIALEVQNELRQVKNTSESEIIGGRPDQIRIEVLPERLSGFGLSIGQVAQAIQKKNQRLNSGRVEIGGQSMTVEAGEFVAGAADLRNLIVSNRGGAPVYLRDVAKIIEGPGETSSIVTYATGPAYKKEKLIRTEGASAVTIAIAKKKGSNGIDVADALLKRVEKLKQLGVITDQVNVAVTRNYGATAAYKVNSLIMKLFIATGIVVFLIWAALGFLWQPALVVAIVIPVVILLTIFYALIAGYTIDRVSLFALIFSIGILVDDAIVVVENIYRNWLIKDSMDDDVTIEAVAEVGNPTILATFTVIAALMPMGFVSGMMGPYMAPIPALGSVAMLASVIAAFIFTPWLVVRLKPSKEQLRAMEIKEHKQVDILSSLFHGTLGSLLDSAYKARLFKMAIWFVFLVSCSLFYFKFVTVKMLPLDNKPEFNVVVNMPDGTALPVTANAIQRMTDEIRNVKEVTAIQSYVGTASPFNFNGLVRHYYLRKEPWQGDIQIQLIDKKYRSKSSHDLAVEVRGKLQEIAKSTGAKIQVVEMPPGPPVLQTIVAEVYGPNDKVRRQVATDMTNIFEKAKSVVDVDNYMTDKHEVLVFKPNTRKLESEGFSSGALTQQMGMLMGGFVLGDAKKGRELEPRSIIIQAPLSIRGDVSRLLELPIMNSQGRSISLGQLGKFERVQQEMAIFRKDLRPVEYVTGEVTGAFAAPVYGQAEIKSLLAEYKNADGSIGYKAPDGVSLSGGFYESWAGLPADTDQSAFSFEGEWTVTFETFRDMGLAFMAAMVLIYALVVWEFGNFRLPAIIMAPIPLTLIGIIPFHGLLGKEFTATSMIGWIALAGIIVRNSILLVDFAKHEIVAGVDKRDAVMNAVIARTRPILVTALALVGGSLVIYSDPIFNGMAISLMAGVMVSTILTLYVIPIAAAVAHGAYGEKLDAVSQPAKSQSREATALSASRGEGEATVSKERHPWIERLMKIGALVIFLVSALLKLLWMGIKWVWGSPPPKSPSRGGSGSGSSGFRYPSFPEKTARAATTPATATQQAIARLNTAAEDQDTVQSKDKDVKVTKVNGSSTQASKSEKADSVQKNGRGNGSKPDTKEKIDLEDITKIKGIGPGIAKKLKSLGLKSLHQIADLSSSDIKKIDEVMTFKGCPEREKWSEQARELLKSA